MPTQGVLLTDFSAGMVSPRVQARLDLPFAQKGAAEITNMVLRPDGGVSRRRANILVREGLGISAATTGLYGAASIPAFMVIRRGEGSSEQSWLLWIDNNAPFELKAMNLATGAVNGSSANMQSLHLEPGEPLDATPTFYMEPSGLVADQHIQFWTPGKAFLLNVNSWVLTQQLNHEVATIYQNRRIVVDRTWGTMKMSVPLDLDNYAVTAMVPIPDTDPAESREVETGAVEVIPDHYGAETTRWVSSRLSLYIGTDAGEYEVVSSQPFFSNDPGGAQVIRISEVGTDQAVYFGANMVLRKGDRLIRSAYGGANQYQTESMAEFIDNGTWVRVAPVEYGSHRYLLALDIDGDLYCMTDAPFSRVRGWTKLAVNIGWVWTYEKDVFVAELDGVGGWNVRIIPLDSLFNPGGRTAYEHEAFRRAPAYSDVAGYVSVEPAAVSGDRLPASVTVTVYKVTSAGVELIGDRATDSSGNLTGTVAEIQAWAGWTAGIGTLVLVATYGATTVSSVKTLPINVATQAGPNLAGYKGVEEVTVVVEETTAFEVRINDGPWERWESATPFTGPAAVVPDGTNAATVQVEVRSVGAQALTIMAIELVVSYEGGA